MPADLFCGTHRALIYNRGATSLLHTIDALELVRWKRVRDDISTAEIRIPTTLCCDVISQLRTVRQELHIQRDGGSGFQTVWQGPITRIEIEQNSCQVFAEDILWVCKRTVLKSGYVQSFPNIGNVLDRMDWLLREKCYACDGNPWNVPGGNLHKVVPASGQPKTSRSVSAYQFTVWEDFDKYAEDSGTDYTVINRHVYYWDIDDPWITLPALDEQYLSQSPRIVEYGNNLVTKAYVSNAKGFAAFGRAVSAQRAIYGSIEKLISRVNDVAPEEQIPDEDDLKEWRTTAKKHVVSPPPLAVVIPANNTLLPGSPWSVDELFPGAWFDISVTLLCRSVTEQQRIHEVVVEETAAAGETVRFTAISAPTAAEA